MTVSERLKALEADMHGEVYDGYREDIAAIRAEVEALAGALRSNDDALRSGLTVGLLVSDQVAARLAPEKP